LYAFYMNHFSNVSGHVMDFFWELATLILIMLLGHWIEMNAVGNAGNALKKMAELLPNKAIKVIDSEQKEEVSISEIEVDDIVEVKAGESIDRKSTRLNSSHVSISYAVFCLKKKKVII